MKKISNQSGFAPIVLLVVLVVLVLVGVGGYWAYTNSNQANKSSHIAQIQPKKTIKKNVKPVPVTVRSKKPGVIVNEVIASATDKTGKALASASQYKSTVGSLGLVLTLNQVKSATSIDYIRYLNGKYFDHRNVKVVTPNLKYLVFYWVVPKGSTLLRPKGQYLVKAYVNGIYDYATTYTIL